MATYEARHSLQDDAEGGWLIALGILSVILGLIGGAMATTLTIAGAIWYGLFLAMLGAANALYAAIFATEGRRWVKFMLATVYVGAGLVLIAFPAFATISLTVLIGLLLVAIGIARGAWAYGQTRGRLWGIFTGILSMALGVFILVRWPFSGLWVLGLFIAADLVLNGVTSIATGLGIRGR